MLTNKRHAMLHAVVLALLPYTAWLSVALVALVTLRKGAHEGFYILMGAMIAHYTLSLWSMPFTIGAINTVLTFAPCYLAAYLLRLTASWRSVAGIFFLQVVVAVVLIQVLIPDFIMVQYQYIQTALKTMQDESALLEFVNDKAGLNSAVLANYLFGIQIVGIIISALLSLMLARSVQSRLFYPGGFREEMLAVRGDKMGFLILLVMFYAANQGNVLAMNLLPVLMFYFLLAGLSLAFNLLARKKMRGSILLLVTPLLLLPFIMLPFYVVIGSLDCLFNFRLYLPASAGKST